MGLFGVVEEIRHKNGEFPYGALQVSDTPLPRQGVAALNATHPDSGTSNGLGSCLLRGGCARIVFLSGLPPRREAAALSLKSISRPGLTQLGFGFLVLGKLGCRHFLTLGSGMGFPRLVHPASSRFAGPGCRTLPHR